MKELIIVRHAKSDWGTEFLKDADRHLNERGYRDAYYLSEWYLKNKTPPEAILSSTAARALSTALIFARTLGNDMKHFLLEDQIYEASVDRLLSVIRTQDNTRNSLMLFGHNPSLTDLCNKLSDDLYFDDIPTCAMISYNFNIKNWSELGAKKGKLNFFQFPKDFKNKD